MNRYMASSITHDLDGLTFPTQGREVPPGKREDGLGQDFGFDPSLTEQSMFDQYSDNTSKAAHWAGFGTHQLATHLPLEATTRKYSPPHGDSVSFPHYRPQTSAVPQTHMASAAGLLPIGSLSLNTKNIAKATSTMFLYGQVTPPRSNSTTSEPSKSGQDPSSAVSEQSATRRKRAKARTKNPLTPPEDYSSPKQKKAGGRKRTIAAQLQTGNAEDEKRKASLEKNRVAAAKCRINKKEKTEQLQRDSYTKAQENTQLRGLVETMEAERNTLAAYLDAHASCVDCRNPHQLKDALQMFRESEVHTHFPGLVGDAGTANTSPVLSASDQSLASGLYDVAALTSTYPGLDPPLPDFNLAGDYDMNSLLPA